MEFIREAGWGIYPVLIFGIAALVVSIRQIVSPQPARVITAKWLMALTGMAGILGTITGLQTTALYVDKVTGAEKWLWLVGMRESLNNAVAAGVIIVLAMLAMLVAHLRSGSTPETVGSSAHRRAGSSGEGDHHAHLSALS